jgi:hypothetical protein
MVVVLQRQIDVVVLGLPSDSKASGLHTREDDSNKFAKRRWV